MRDRVIIDRQQQVTSKDLNNMGLFPQASFDLLVREAIDPGIRYSGFTVIESAPATINVGEGILISDGMLYENDQENGTTISLINELPAIANRYVAVVSWGTEVDAEVEPRTFLIDTVTRQTEARAVATVKRRVANLDKLLGTESTAPLAPLIPANTVLVALVLLSPAGIVSITQNMDNQLVSTRELADALAELNLWRAQTGKKLETIQTDVTGLSDKMRGAVRVENFLEVSRDVSQLKSLSGLPQSYSSYGSDPFLALAQSHSDVPVVTGAGSAHPNFDCKVEEGIRFAPIIQREAPLALLNPDDSRVRRQNDLVMPAYTEVQRVQSIGFDDEISLSQYENQTISLVQKKISRQRTRYGSTQTVCTNSAWWQSGKYDPLTGIFKRAGETFDVDVDPLQPGANLADPNHRLLRVRQFWVDTYEEAYWDAQTETTSVNGSVIAQTFLNSQESWITAIGLYFTKIGNANVTLAICETTESGAPNLEAIVARTTIEVADIKLSPLQTKVPLPPTLLQRGKRYAIVPISTGAHFLALSTGNKFNQGSLFTSTDGSWFQGDLVKDLSFVVYAAAFASPRVEVQLEPLELSGGILLIDILADAVIPDGTSLSYEVKVNNVWTPLAETSLDALAFLPPLLQFRAIFQGTTDLMPRLGVSSRSRVFTERPKQTFTHVSDALTPPAPVNTVWVDIRLEAWDAAHNTALVRLLSGAGYNTTTVAATVQDRPDPNGDPTAIIRRYVFTFGSAISSFKIRTDGTTDSVLRIFHVALRQFVALNV